ncbi:MAG: hypothetical protein JRJ39_07845 [Deltaproteobacteria bacterium]|nr:hypothetical protein [Deltaproteobacteria bacterium]MBW1848090.1 hypothetical protein [Deltaproteobacteria bacterium]
MKRYVKYMTVYMVGLILLWGAPTFALELLHEKQGKAYYKTKDGKTIEHQIKLNAKSPTFIYKSKDKRVIYYRAPNGKILEARLMGAPVNSSNVPQYDWRNGCSPTSAGMMMGYYDLNGYGGLYYQKLIPRGPAELNTFVPSSQRANKAISSRQHIADYYTSYGSTGDSCDGSPTTCHGGSNCLADFMGTSQDMDWLTITTNCSDSGLSTPVNLDGQTQFWNYLDGNALPWTTIDDWDDCFWETSGMYGIAEYVQYRGYSVSSLYNQYIHEQISGGFTFANFKTEIDNGRPALLNLDGHTMLAYGYLGTSTVYIRDTWNAGVHTMTWNGTYGPSGGPYMQHLSMTCFTPSGGSAVPDDIIPNIAPLLIILLGT